MSIDVSQCLADDSATQKHVVPPKMLHQCLQQSLNEFRTILFLSRAWQRTSRDRWSHAPMRPIRVQPDILKAGRSTLGFPRRYVDGDWRERFCHVITYVAARPRDPVQRETQKKKSFQHIKFNIFKIITSAEISYGSLMDVY